MTPHPQEDQPSNKQQDAQWKAKSRQPRRCHNEDVTDPQRDYTNYSSAS